MDISQTSYETLLANIQAIIGETHSNLNNIIREEKIKMSWNIGRIIDQNLAGNTRSGYGEQLFTKLESDIAIAKRVLYQMHGFYKNYPELPSATNGLSWTHYKNLSAINDPVSRKYFQDMAIEKSLGVKQLAQEIAAVHTKKKTVSTPKINDDSPLPFTRGHLFTYKIQTSPQTGKKMIDCGFHIFRHIPTNLADGTVVACIKDDDHYSFFPYTKPSSTRYTYKAYLDKVVDGDTLRVVIDLGFETHHREILRLSGINAPEKSTSAGKKSLAGLENILQNAPFLIIKTNKIDMYGRYIADVFFDDTGKSNPQTVADEGVYLSQKIVDLGLADIY